MTGLAVAGVEGACKPRLGKRLQPRVRTSTWIQLRPVGLGRIADLDLPRVNVQLWMTVEEGAEQGPARTLDLGDQHERLIDVDERFPAGVEDALGLPPIRQTESRLRRREQILVDHSVMISLARKARACP